MVVVGNLHVQIAAGYWCAAGCSCDMVGKVFDVISTAKETSSFANKDT